MYEEIRESMDSDNAAETVSAEPEVEISTLPENHESNGNTEDAPESCYLPPEAQEKRREVVCFCRRTRSSSIFSRAINWKK